jgi:hypothetical protein
MRWWWCLVCSNVNTTNMVIRTNDILWENIISSNHHVSRVHVRTNQAPSSSHRISLVLITMLVVFTLLLVTSFSFCKTVHLPWWWWCLVCSNVNTTNMVIRTNDILWDDDDAWFVLTWIRLTWWLELKYRKSKKDRQHNDQKYKQQYTNHTT